MGGIQKGAKQSGVHTGSGVKKPTLVTRGGKSGSAKHQGYDGSTKGSGGKPSMRRRGGSHY